MNYDAIPHNPINKQNGGENTVSAFTKAVV